MYLSSNTTLISRSLFSLLVILAASSTLEAGWFVDIDGVPGQATEKSHKNWIVAESVQFGVAREVASPDGKSASSSAARLSEVTLTRRMDVSSPDLFIRAAGGQVASQATLELTDGVGAVRVRIALKDVAVTAYTVSASEGEMFEEIKVTYSAITLTYYAVGADGRSTEQHSRTWDVVRNMEI